MHWPISKGPFGVNVTGKILTDDGWQPLTQVKPGTRLAHPTDSPSVLLQTALLSERDMVKLTLSDRTAVVLDADQPLPVVHGSGRSARHRVLDSHHLRDLLDRDALVRLSRHAAYEYGHVTALPLDPWLLGVLLGDAYLRPHSVEWCNEDPEMYELVTRSLPSGSMLTPLRYGPAGTGSATITATGGRSNRHNPVLFAIQDLGLGGCRAWEKFIPKTYVTADRATRHALLSGLLDTDGSIDRIGRIEFSSSSEQLAQDVLELIHGLGGRSGYVRKTGVRFTSPRQSTPKAARDSFRLTNIRLPEDLAPFRRPEKAARMVPNRGTRHWKLIDVSSAGHAEALAVSVSAADGKWIGDGAFTLMSNPLLTTSVAA